MTCRHCGHLNPPENRFCGMCGHMLLSGAKAPERVSEPAAPRPQVAEPPRKREAAGAPLTGPSFLGLSSAPSSPEPSTAEPSGYEPSGYSYLFQDEPESSHRGLYIFLLLLVIGGAIAYARWQPIRQYVVSNVIPLVRQQAAPPPQPQPAPPVPARDQATISVSSSQPEDKPAEAAAAPTPTTPEPGRPTLQADSAQSADTKNQDAKSPEKEILAAKAKQAPPAAEDDSSDEEAPASAPAARHARPQPPAGDALVNTGEKYLYGRGVRKNCNQAVSYFRAAAEQQNLRALSRLGTMYAIGECVPMDRAIAYSWFGRALALNRNNRVVERNMSMLWREMSPEERQRAGGR